MNHLESLEKNGHGGFVGEVIKAKKGIKIEELTDRRKEILMLAKANSILPKFTAKLPTLEGLKLIWSMWTGYLTEDASFTKFCKKNNLSWENIHTSGHASIEDLKRLNQAILPGHLVPFHTFHPEQYMDIFPNVLELSDGEEFTI